MLCRERLTQPDCFVDSLLPHGPGQIFLCVLWKRSQDVNLHSAGSPSSSRGLLFPLHLGPRTSQHLPQGVWLIFCSVWDKVSTPSTAQCLWEVGAPLPGKDSSKARVSRKNSRSQQLRGRESNFCASLAVSALPVGKAKGTQRKRPLYLAGGMGCRCSRNCGEEGKWLQMEEPQGSPEDTGTTTKAYAVPP